MRAARARGSSRSTPRRRVSGGQGRPRPRAACKPLPRAAHRQPVADDAEGEVVGQDVRPRHQRQDARDDEQHQRPPRARAGGARSRVCSSLARDRQDHVEASRRRDGWRPPAVLPRSRHSSRCSAMRSATQASMRALHARPPARLGGLCRPGPSSRSSAARSMTLKRWVSRAHSRLARRRRRGVGFLVRLPLAEQLVAIPRERDHVDVERVGTPGVRGGQRRRCAHAGAETLGSPAADGLRRRNRNARAAGGFPRPAIMAATALIDSLSRCSHHRPGAGLEERGIVLDRRRRRASPIASSVGLVDGRGQPRACRRHVEQEVARIDDRRQRLGRDRQSAGW